MPVKRCSEILPRHVRDYIRTRSHALAPFSAAPEPEKKFVQPHTAGLWT